MIVINCVVFEQFRPLFAMIYSPSSGFCKQFTTNWGRSRSRSIKTMSWKQISRTGFLQIDVIFHLLLFWLSLSGCLLLQDDCWQSTECLLISPSIEILPILLGGSLSETWSRMTIAFLINEYPANLKSYGLQLITIFIVMV